MGYIGRYVTHPEFNDNSIFKVLYKEGDIYICVRYSGSHNTYNTCSIDESVIEEQEVVDDYENRFSIDNKDYVEFLRNQ